MKAARTGAALAIILVWPICAWAGWSGPEEVITGQWGSGDAQFGFFERYNRAEFPTLLLIDEEGNIIITDPVNTRAKVYAASGKLSLIMKPKLAYDDIKKWPPTTIAVSNQRLLVFNEGVLQHYDYPGNLKNEVRLPTGQFISFLPNGQFVMNIIEKKENETYGATQRVQQRPLGDPSPGGPLIHASGSDCLDINRNRRCENNEPFNRKVVVNSSELIRVNPTGFGRIKLWD